MSAQTRQARSARNGDYGGRHGPPFARNGDYECMEEEEEEYVWLS